MTKYGRHHGQRPDVVPHRAAGGAGSLPQHTLFVGNGAWLRGIYSVPARIHKCTHQAIMYSGCQQSFIHTSLFWPGVFDKLVVVEERYVHWYHVVTLLCRQLHLNNFTGQGKDSSDGCPLIVSGGRREGPSVELNGLSITRVVALCLGWLSSHSQHGSSWHCLTQAVLVRVNWFYCTLAHPCVHTYSITLFLKTSVSVYMATSLSLSLFSLLYTHIRTPNHIT